MKAEFDRAKATKFEHTMFIDKEKRNEEILRERQVKEVTLIKDLSEVKTKEVEKLTADQQKHDDAWKTKDQIQSKLVEEKKTREEIEELKVQKLSMDIDIILLQDNVELLRNKKQELENEKQDAEIKLEELKIQLTAQEDAANKKLMNKLNKDKTPEMKDKTEEQAILKEFNETMTVKLVEEKEKFDKLTDAMITIKEEIKIKTAQFEEDTLAVDAQKKELEELNAKIAAEQTIVDDLTQKVNDGRKLRAVEEDKNRTLTATNAARKAKKEWIEKTYNYHENVEQLKPDIFAQITATNIDVNKQVELFAQKLSQVQTQFKTIKASTIVI